MMKRITILAAGVLLVCAVPGVVRAQQKGEPGKFDFYLLNVVPAQEFCSIKDVGPACHARDGFVLHGRWAHKNDGTYPFFCSQRPGPLHPEKDLDITPDLTLLAHEWAKHGTCTTLRPDAFFQQERRAYRALAVPQKFIALDAPITLAPGAIVAEFERANPAYPQGSIIVWCSQKKLTSVSACLTKDLKPIACRGVTSCKGAAIEVEPVKSIETPQ